MSVSKGTRPGTKPTTKYPGWDYVKSSGPGWEAIHKDQRMEMYFEDGINKAIADAEKALAGLYIAQVMLHGGHVDRGTMARSGLKRDMQPAAVIAHIQRFLGHEIKAVVDKK